MAEHLHAMQDPDLLKSDGGVPRFMKHYVERDKAMFALDRKDIQIAGVHVYDYAPKAGVAVGNRRRVLINLHGGGFSGCWPGCAELESMPVAALMGIRVVSIDYREGPKYKFPAASEDVAKVYQQLLKTYPSKNIGIYGCSAGGMLTAMSLAWFQTHGLPTPGADGIYCASAGSFGGDALFIAYPLGEARIPSAAPSQSRLGYFSEVDMNRSSCVSYRIPRDTCKISANAVGYCDTRFRHEQGSQYGCPAHQSGSRFGTARMGRTLPWFLL